MFKKLLGVVLAGLLICSVGVGVTFAGPAEFGETGWYQKVHGNNKVKFFEKGHPMGQSEWRFLGTENNFADAMAGGFGNGQTDWLGGYGFDNSASASMQSFNSSVKAGAFHWTGINIESDGFVENMKPGMGGVVAFSEGSVNARTLVVAGAKIYELPEIGSEHNFTYLGCLFWNKEIFNVYEGSGAYTIENSINMMAYQENGALAQMGTNDLYNTWAGGGNHSGGSIVAVQTAADYIVATREVGIGIDGFFFIPYNFYSIDRLDGQDKVFAGMIGVIDGDGFTVAGAYRTRNDNFALAAAGALTHSWSTANLYAFGNVPYEVDSYVTAFGGGGVSHKSFASLPDGSSSAGTYGSANYGYGAVGVNSAQGSGIAGTGGVATIHRADGVLNVSSTSASFAQAGAFGNN